MSDSDKPDPLARLGRELDRAQAARAPRPKVGGGAGNLQHGMGLGFRIGLEFVVAIVVATGLGMAIGYRSSIASPAAKDELDDEA